MSSLTLPPRRHAHHTHTQVFTNALILAAFVGTAMNLNVYADVLGRGAFAYVRSHLFLILRLYLVPFLVAAYSGTVGHSPGDFAAVFPRDASVWAPALATSLVVPVALYAARRLALYMGVCVLLLGPTPAGGFDVDYAGSRHAGGSDYGNLGGSMRSYALGAAGGAAATATTLSIDQKGMAAGPALATVAIDEAAQPAGPFPKKSQQQHRAMLLAPAQRTHTSSSGKGDDGVAATRQTATPAAAAASSSAASVRGVGVDGITSVALSPASARDEGDTLRGGGRERERERDGRGGEDGVMVGDRRGAVAGGAGGGAPQR